MSRKETRKEREARLRDEEKARLLESYQEGISNIEWSKVVASDWSILFAETRRDDLPMITKEEWLARKLAKYDEGRPKVPNHRVQDPEAKVVIFRRKFVEFAKEAKPDAFEELRSLVPAFKALFTHKVEKDYVSIINDLKIDLIGHRLPNPAESFNYRFNFNYVWGELRTTFSYAHFSMYFRNPQFDHIFSDASKTILEYYEHTLSAFTSAVTRRFEETASKKDEILLNFFHLHGEIYKWVEKYNLKQDWLVDYAYYFVFQFSKKPDIPVNGIEVGQRYYSPRTMYMPFDFKTNGWWASEEGETANQYQKRVTDEFDEALEQYILNATSYLDLDKLKKFTKPPTYESVEWLAYRVIRDWDSEKIVEKFFPEIAASRTRTQTAKRAFESKKKNIENEMRKLKKYGLPVPGQAMK